MILEKGLRKTEHPLLLATIAKEKIDALDRTHLKIFTDGSIGEDGQVGCAFTIPDHDVCGRFKLNKGLSIFTAELYAICKALSYADTLEDTPHGVAILSDSKSSLQALSKGGTRNRSTLQQETLYLAHKLIAKRFAVTLMWLPLHTGIRGNDLAD